MAVPPAPGGDAVADPSDSPDTTPSDSTPDPRRSRSILVVAFVVVAVCLVASLVALGRAGWSFGDLVDEQTNPQSERDEVMASARTFVTEFSKYGPEDLDDQNRMPGYLERVEKLLTSKFATTFEQGVQFAEQSVAQQHVSREGQVYAVAVERMDDDSARVLVAGRDTIAVPNPKKPQELLPYADQTFRYEVDLILTQGDWLVDDFGPVGTLDGEGETPPTTQPTQQPTRQPTQGGTRNGGGDGQ